jgi:predicted nucleic acid-binding protein
VDGHPQHARAATTLLGLAKNTRAFVSGHGLAELSSVLTRAPFAPRIYPAEAWRMIEQNVLSRCQVVSLDAAEHQELVRECSAKGWIGGRVYDASHVRHARKVACDRLYTFDVRHFRVLAPDALARKICAP